MTDWIRTVPLPREGPLRLDWIAADVLIFNPAWTPAIQQGLGATIPQGADSRPVLSSSSTPFYSPSLQYSSTYWAAIAQPLAASIPRASFVSPQVAYVDVAWIGQAVLFNPAIHASIVALQRSSAVLMAGFAPGVQVQPDISWLGQYLFQVAHYNVATVPGVTQGLRNAFVAPSGFQSPLPYQPDTDAWIGQSAAYQASYYAAIQQRAFLLPRGFHWPAQTAPSLSWLTNAIKFDPKTIDAIDQTMATAFLAPRGFSAPSLFKPSDGWITNALIFKAAMLPPILQPRTAFVVPGGFAAPLPYVPDTGGWLAMATAFRVSFWAAIQQLSVGGIVPAPSTLPTFGDTGTAWLKKGAGVVDARKATDWYVKHRISTVQ